MSIVLIISLLFLSSFVVATNCGLIIIAFHENKMTSLPDQCEPLWAYRACSAIATQMFATSPACTNSCLVNMLNWWSSGWIDDHRLGIIIFCKIMIIMVDCQRKFTIINIDILGRQHLLNQPQIWFLQCWEQPSDFQTLDWR